ncbi:MAG: hypothetical protein NTY77_11850 [Elusimicrobia bacterium]|nr:hypothetical protein [Elusimicrobiota bacterium]
MRKIATLSAMFALMFASEARADEVLVRASADFSALVLQARQSVARTSVPPAQAAPDLDSEIDATIKGALRGGNLDSRMDRLDHGLKMVWTQALGPEGQQVPWERVAQIVTETRLNCAPLTGINVGYWWFLDPGPASHISKESRQAGGAKAHEVLGAIRDNREYIIAAAPQDSIRARYDMAPGYGDWGKGVNQDVLKAVDKLSGGDPAQKGRYAAAFTKDGKSAALPQRQALGDLRAAFGAVTEDQLPAQLSGFAAKDALLLISDWLGQEGLAKFQYHLTLADDSVVTLYDIPMLDQWVQANAISLDRVLRQSWVRMPIEKSALWAAEELAIRKGLGGTDSLLTATPQALYIQRQDYPGFMELYRGDKRALGGEEIAGAINGFKADLVAKLEELRQAQMSIARAVDSNTSATGGLSGEMAGVRRAIDMGTLTNILLRFVH